MTGQATGLLLRQSSRTELDPTASLIESHTANASRQRTLLVLVGQQVAQTWIIGSIAEHTQKRLVREISVDEDYDNNVQSYTYSALLEFRRHEWKI